jgi:hypothetical protein
LDGVSSRAHLSGYAGHHYRDDKRKAFSMNIISIEMGADILFEVRRAVYIGTPRLRVQPPISAVRQMGRTVGHDGMTPQSLDNSVSPAYSLLTGSRDPKSWTTS